MRASLSVLVLAAFLSFSPPRGLAQAARCPWALGDTLRALVDSLSHSDPGADARAAADRGDRRFLGVQQYSLVVPGSPAGTASRPSDYRVLQHTGDNLIIVVCAGPDGVTKWDSLHVIWQRVAYNYAIGYNTAMERLLREPKR